MQVIRMCFDQRAMTGSGAQGEVLRGMKGRIGLATNTLPPYS